MHVYLVRHGQSKANESGIYQGWMDAELTQTGISQAKKVSSKLPSRIDLVVSSPLTRAYKTAQISLGQRNNEIHVFEGLKEMNIGIMEGVKRSEMTDNQKQIWKEIRQDLHYNQHQGESGYEFTQRVVKSFERILSIANLQRYEHIVIFSHFGVMQVLVGEFMNLEYDHFENGEMYTYRLKNGIWLEDKSPAE